MSIADLWAEIEADQAWRQDEIRFVQNQSTFVPPDKQDQFRRVLILLLYAHFEGFCKFAFTLYVNSINAECIRCSDANYAIAAASLSDLFKNLRNPEKWMHFRISVTCVSRKLASNLSYIGHIPVCHTTGCEGIGNWELGIGILFYVHLCFYFAEMKRGSSHFIA